MINYLIIGGSTKCATTSLFKYLADHPNICSSVYKETRYFLSPDYPLKKHFPDCISLDDYNNLFKKCNPDSIKMEATPDYLYSKNTELEIKKSLPNCFLVFVLRNPIDRLISWYNFSIQNNFLSPAVPFDEYVQLMNNSNKVNVQYLMALEQGKYFKFLMNYINAFGHENIHFIIYEDLIQSPDNELKIVCEKLNISSEIYNSYDFVAHNKSIAIKNSDTHNIFLKSKRYIRKKLINKSGPIKESLKQGGKLVESLYLNLNAKKPNSIVVKKKTKEFLVQYYLDSNRELENFLNKKLDWD